MYGNPETTTGGLALKFYSSVRLEVRRSTAIKDGDTPIGSEVKIKVVKNKIAPPFRVAEVELYHDRGLDLEGDVLKLGVEEEIVSKSGAFLSYGETRLGQGKDNARTFLRENPGMRDEIAGKIREKRQPPPVDATSATPEPAADAPAEEAPAAKKKK
jgi:recombination protein RecA